MNPNDEGEFMILRNDDCLLYVVTSRVSLARTREEESETDNNPTVSI